MILNGPAQTARDAADSLKQISYTHQMILELPYCLQELAWRVHLCVNHLKYFALGFLAVAAYYTLINLPISRLFFCLGIIGVETARYFKFHLPQVEDIPWITLALIIADYAKVSPLGFLLAAYTALRGNGENAPSENFLNKYQTFFIKAERISRKFKQKVKDLTGYSVKTYNVDSLAFPQLREDLFKIKSKLAKASDYEFMALFTDFMAHCEAYIIFAALGKCPLSQKEVFTDLDALKAFVDELNNPSKDDLQIDSTMFFDMEFFDNQVAILISEKDFLDPAVVTYQDNGGKSFYLTENNPKIPFGCYFSKTSKGIQSQVEVVNRTKETILQVFENNPLPGSPQDDPTFSELDYVAPGETKNFPPNIWIAEMKIIADQAGT